MGTTVIRSIKTKKELKTLSGRKFKRVLDNNILAVEDIESYEKLLLKSLVSQGLDPKDFKSDENKWSFGNQFLMKPKRKREQIGEVIFRSNDYIFKYDGMESMGGKMSEITLIGNGFSLDEAGITYYLID